MIYSYAISISGVRMYDIIFHQIEKSLQVWWSHNSKRSNMAGDTLAHDASVDLPTYLPTYLCAKMK